MSDRISILGISGSLRKASYNTALLRVAEEGAPANVTITRAEIGDFPLYNGDLEAKGFPAPVERVVEQVRKADALLFALPEYNYSMPGVLKNAIDWVSRVKNQPFAGKPAAIMGASIGGMGSSRSQYHFRQTSVFLDLKVLNRPEVMVPTAQTKFDDQGKLTDDATRQRIDALVVALLAWTQQLKG